MLNGNGNGKRMAFVVLALLLLNYAILSVFRPGGLMAYIFPSACWGFLAIVALKACGFGRIRSWFNRRVTIAAASVAIFFVIILMNIGLFTGFGRSAFSFAPTALIINSILVLSTLLGMEFSRTYIIKTFGRGRPFLTIGLVTLLYSFVTISAFRLLAINDPLGFATFLGVGLLPIIAENLLASYLSLIGGPVASLAYRGPLMAFWWFCPILPQLSWGIEAFLGVMVPVMGFFLINQFTSPLTLRRAGIPTEAKGFGRKKRSPLRNWMVVSISAVLIVWVSTGLLGIQPTTVLSGSMSPAMDVGDMAIVREVPADSIVAGDIIQYQLDGTMVIHRVTDVSQGGSEKLFVTQGDANSKPDSGVVYPDQVRGKVLLTIPKLGWAVIAAQGFISGAWSFLSANVALVALAFTLGACTLIAIRLRKNRSFRKWRAPRWRRKGLTGGKLMAPLASIFILTAASGFAYSCWSENLYVSGTVETGSWHTEIEDYQVCDFCFICDVDAELSDDKRTLDIDWDHVLPCQSVWVALKIHNVGTVPVHLKGLDYVFDPPEAKDKFTIESYFYPGLGPWPSCCLRWLCWWRKWTPSDPPIQVHPGEDVTVLIKLRSRTCLCRPLHISITVVDECWSIDG